MKVCLSEDTQYTADFNPFIGKNSSKVLFLCCCLSHDPHILFFFSDIPFKYISHTDTDHLPAIILNSPFILNRWFCTFQPLIIDFFLLITLVYTNTVVLISPFSFPIIWATISPPFLVIATSKIPPLWSRENDICYLFCFLLKLLFILRNVVVLNSCSQNNNRFSIAYIFWDTSFYSFRFPLISQLHYLRAEEKLEKWNVKR